MSPELVGILGIVLLLILFALRMQVGLSMLIVGFVGFAYLTNTSSSLTLLGMVPYATASCLQLKRHPVIHTDGDVPILRRIGKGHF